MGGSRLFFLFVHSVLVSCCCAVAGAQDDPDEEPFVPGLIAEFTQPNLPTVQRLESVVAAHWPQRPDERLRSGELFTVTYRGLLEIPDDGSYQLHVHGNGDVHRDRVTGDDQTQPRHDGRELADGVPRAGVAAEACRLTLQSLVALMFLGSAQKKHFAPGRGRQALRHFDQMRFRELLARETLAAAGVDADHAAVVRGLDAE